MSYFVNNANYKCNNELDSERKECYLFVDNATI